MTLVISHVMSTGYACVTSDTMARTMRYTGVPYGPDTKFIGEPRESDKTELLTNNVILSSSGMQPITDPVRKLLRRRTKKIMYLDDCIPLLKSVWEEVQAKYVNDWFFVSLKDDKQYSVTLTGFYKNGATGRVDLDAGKVTEMVCQSEGEYQKAIVSISSPSQEVSDLADTLKKPIFKAGSMEEVAEQYNVIHALVAATHPEVVSKKMKMLWLQIEEGNIVSNTVTIDISHRVEFYKKALQSIKQDQ